MAGAIQSFFLAYWDWISFSVMAAALLIFVSSLDDAFLDLTYWLGFLGRHEVLPSTAAVRRKKEMTAAILIPAWQESGVIGAMLARLAGTMDYTAFHVFVGTYPNDPDTGEAVREISRRFPNIHCVVVKNPGPTSKADCLNQLIQTVIDYESNSGLSFGLFVMQDSEDVIHPFSLKAMNWFADRYAMVQMPVLSLNRGWANLVPCHYMDEFAEWHGKDMLVRSQLTGSVPSAGVATAFSREGLEMLREGDGPIFNASSLTEDYEIAHRLHQLGGEAKFIRYFADMPTLRKRWFREECVSATRREIVATREFFPHKFQTAVRQKARWMLGISYLGWKNIGWYGNGWNRYFLMRDRKGLITAPAAMFAYLIVLEYLIAVGVITLMPGLGPLPPLVRHDWLWTIILINFGFLVSRLLQRAWFVGITHGLEYVWLSPVRAVLGNFVAFFAFWRATKQFLGIKLASRPIKWDKTDHHYPDAAMVKDGKPSVAEVLQHNGLITHGTMRLAVEAMRDTRRPLGLQLLDMNAIDDVALARAYAECEGVSYASVDPLTITSRTVKLMKRQIAARYCALPWMRLDAHRLVVALGEPLSRRGREKLEEGLRWKGIRSVSYVFVPLSDVAFGIRYLYAPDEGLLSAQIALSDLLQDGRVGEETQAEIWRLVRRGYVRLGDMLMRAGMLDQPLLQKALKKSWRRGRPFGEILAKSNQVPLRKLNELIAQHQAWQPDPVALAIRAGFLPAPEPAPLASAETLMTLPPQEALSA